MGRLFFSTWVRGTLKSHFHELFEVKILKKVVKENARNAVTCGSGPEQTYLGDQNLFGPRANIFLNDGEETWFPLRETRFPLKETWFPLRGTWFPLRETWFPLKETWLHSFSGYEHVFLQFHVAMILNFDIEHFQNPTQKNGSKIFKIGLPKNVGVEKNKRPMS